MAHTNVAYAALKPFHDQGVPISANADIGPVLPNARELHADENAPNSLTPFACYGVTRFVQLAGGALARLAGPRAAAPRCC